MKKLLLTLTVCAIGFTGHVIKTANAAPPPVITVPTMVNAYYIHAWFAPCHVYRYFATYQDAMNFISISTGFTYAGTTSVPSTYNLAWPGTEDYRCATVNP